MEIVVCLIVIVALSPIYSYRMERLEWNNGICAKTGQPWQKTEADKTGAVCYKSGTETLWVDWDFSPKWYRSPVSFLLSQINAAFDRAVLARQTT